MCFRGSRIVSRLASFYDERFLGYGFLAVPYCAPRPQSTMEGTLKVVSLSSRIFLSRYSMGYKTKRMCGYELFGHILFLADDPEELVESHVRIASFTLWYDLLNISALN